MKESAARRAAESLLAKHKADRPAGGVVERD
jgi:hypothetical protein